MNKETPKRSDAQHKADANYEKKRAKQTQLSGYLSTSEAQLLDEVSKDYLTKKEAIIAGLRILKEIKENGK